MAQRSSNIIKALEHEIMNGKPWHDIDDGKVYFDSVPAAPSYVKQFSNLEAVDSLEHSRGQAPMSLTQASKPLQVRLKPTPS